MCCLDLCLLVSLYKVKGGLHRFDAICEINELTDFVLVLVSIQYDVQHVHFDDGR